MKFRWQNALRHCICVGYQHLAACVADRSRNGGSNTLDLDHFHRFWLFCVATSGLRYGNLLTLRAKQKPPHTGFHYVRTDPTIFTSLITQTLSECQHLSVPFIGHMDITRWTLLPTNNFKEKLTREYLCRKWLRNRNS